MRDCAPTRQPGAFRLVLFVMVPLLLMQVTSLADEYKPEVPPQQPQPAPGQGTSPGLGALLQGTVPQQAEAPPAQLGALAGQELQRQGDINDAAAGLINAMLGGGEGPKPEIQRVFVLEDSERRLVLRVTTANAAHASIYGRVRDHQAAFQQQILGYRYQVPPNSNDVDLTFTLGEDAAPGTAFDSASLVLYLVHPGGSFARPDAVRTYLLPKRWESTIRPGNVVVDVVLRPVGELVQRSVPSPGADQTPPPLPPLRTYATPPPVLLSAEGGLTTRGEEGEGGRTLLWLGSEAPKPIVSTRGTAAVNQFVLQPQIARLALQPQTARLALLKTNRLAVTPQRVYQMPKKVVDRNGKGPDPKREIDLLNQVHVGADVEFALDDVTSIWRKVYGDLNPDSNLYYFGPRRYSLGWNEDSGHEMRILFRTTVPGGDEEDTLPPGMVALTAWLRSRVDQRDVELMRKLLWARLGNKNAELLPFPAADPPKVSLGQELTSSFDVAPEQINIVAGSDSNDEVQISWVTEQRTLNDLKLALRTGGLDGRLAYEVGGDEGLSVGAGVGISIDGEETYQRILWARGRNWKNLTPFPVKLRYMHALMVRSGTPVVYSWALDDARVPPLGTARFDARAVGSWVDGKDTLRTWIDFTIESCDECGKAAIAALETGATAYATQRIGFETLSPLDDIGAHRLNVVVRSRYLHPTDRELVTLPEMRLDRDGKDFYVDRPLYLGDRDPATASDPIFEYMLSVVMPDGSFHQGRSWIVSEQLMPVITPTQIRQSLGYLPGEEQAP